MRTRSSAAVGPVLILVMLVDVSRAAQIWVTGVLEETPGKYSRCVGMSEDGTRVVGNSKKRDPATGQTVDAPFYWSKLTGLREMTSNSGGNSYVTGCASHSDGSLVACGNIGGLARQWVNGTWSLLPANPPQTSANVRSVYAISHDSATRETWIVGSSYPQENEKAYRYRASDHSWIDFWGYYQDAYGVARNGWAVGKNNWGNGQTNPDWRYDHAIFIFNWNANCSGGGHCGWDQLKRFAGYGDSNYYKSRATAINGSATWAVGYQTYNPSDLGLYHAFKWQVPANPTLALEPGLSWPRPVDLGVLGAGDTQSFAYCVSDHATNPIIGGSSYGLFKHAGYKAVYWDNAGVHDLHAELMAAGVDLSRWTSLSRVNAVSGNGRYLAGYGLYDDDDNSGTPPIEMGFVVDLVGTDPQPPVITQHPKSQERCYGGTASFTVGATGGGSLSYRWQKNQVDLTNGGHYSGVASHVLTITNADADDLAAYRCVVTNIYGTATSNEAVLTLSVEPPPAPADGSATALSTDRISWQWAGVTGASGYRVKDTTGTTVSSELPANVTAWQEVNLTANTRYQRRIFAFNACGESAGSAGQTRYTLAMPATYGNGVTTPTITSDKGYSLAGLSAGAVVTFVATNGFGDGPARVGRFGYLWNQSPGTLPGWAGEQFWTGGSLALPVGASGDWYLHLRSYNNDNPKAVNPTVFRLGPYTVGGATGLNCLQNAGFEEGFTSGVANGWTKFNYAGNVTCSESTTQFRSGSRAQAIYSANSSNEGGIFQQLATTPGQTYTVRMWVKCSNNQIAAYLGVDPLGGTNAASSTVQWSTATSTNWVQNTWTGTAQAGRITVYIDAGSTTSTSGTVWVDDIEPACGAIPATPADGLPQALSTTAIRWMWSDVAGETGYRVITTEGTSVSGDLPADTVVWDETTGISPNTQHTRRVVAFNAAGASAPSAGQTKYSAIETPTGVTFSTITPTSVDATAAGTLSNLASGGSGVRVENVTLGTHSGWQTSQTAWTSAGLSPNTRYGFVARARNGDAIETADSIVDEVWTLSAPPATESIQPARRAVTVGTSVAWSAVQGFGSGQVQYYQYAWDQSPTYTFTGDEPQWSAGELETVPQAAGTWYLHVRGFNGAGVPNGTFDYPLTACTAIQADFTADCRVDGDDVLIFTQCSSGPGVGYDPQALPPGCPLVPDTDGHIAADFDADGDVDQSDFGEFQRCITGP